MSNKTITLGKIPVFELFCTETEGLITGLALVDEPAISLGWMTFAKANFHPNCRCEITAKGVVKLAEDACDFCKEAKRAYNATKKRKGSAPRGIQWINPDDLAFKKNEDKMVLTGPFMIPDIKIPRVSDTGERYDVFFSEDTVREMAKSFVRNKGGENLNEQHSSTKAPAYVFESWIVEDPETDKSRSLGYRVPKGTWFGSVQVTDKDYWTNSIKEGKLTGFSIEVDSPKSKIKMNKEKLSFVKLDDGRDLIGPEGADELKVGDAAFIDGEVAPDGEYVTGEVTITVKDGIVSDIKEDEGEVETEANEELAEVAGLEAFRAEMTGVITDLTARITSLEASLLSAQEELSKTKEEFAKSKSKNSPVKSVLLSKREESKPEKFNTNVEKPRITLAAAQAIANYRDERK